MINSQLERGQVTASDNIWVMVSTCLNSHCSQSSAAPEELEISAQVASARQGSALSDMQETHAAKATDKMKVCEATDVGGIFSLANTILVGSRSIEKHPWCCSVQVTQCPLAGALLCWLPGELDSASLSRVHPCCLLLVGLASVEWQEAVVFYSV